MKYEYRIKWGLLLRFNNNHLFTNLFARARRIKTWCSDVTCTLPPNGGMQLWIVSENSRYDERERVNRIGESRVPLCTSIRVRNYNLPKANEKQNERLSVPSVSERRLKENTEQFGSQLKHIDNYVHCTQQKNARPEPSGSCQNLCRLQCSKWNFDNGRKMRNPCHKSVCACSSRELPLLLLLPGSNHSSYFYCFI